MTEAIQVLHVAGDLDAAALASAYLGRTDDRFEVISCSNARDGLARLDEDRIDCIVSGYRLPGMDGLEFLRTVRSDHPNLPFIVFTGQGSEEVASAAISFGATDYFQKSTGTDQYDLLANRIAIAVERYRAKKHVIFLECVRDFVRDVNQSLVRAHSRAEIEHLVCEVISGPEIVHFVVYSEIDPETNRVEPRTWAGAESAKTFLDAVDITIGAPTDEPQTPHERAMHDRTLASSLDIRTDPAFDRWRSAVDASGGRALVVLPIAFDADFDGLLALYGTNPQPIDDVRELLEELGDDIAHAIYTSHTQRELAESEGRYRNLAETASDAIVRIDESSTITYANPATEDLFGYSPEVLQGAPLSTLMPERLQDKHREGFERYLCTGERRLDWTNVELFGRRIDGTEVPLSVTFGEFDADDQRFFTGIIRDVTDREERKAALQRQVQYLDEFVGTVAHDLRNPLNVVRGHLELVDGAGDGEDLEAAIETIDRMGEIIDDLLAFARQNQAIRKDERVELSAVVTTACEAIDGDALTLQADLGSQAIVASSSSVLELVENLFQNAVEHGGSEPTIRVERLEDGFAIEDDGDGIPEDRHDVIFEPGYTTKSTGIGFGLNIVKKIVEAHGWEITVTRGVDDGARFEITGVEVEQ